MKFFRHLNPALTVAIILLAVSSCKQPVSSSYKDPLNLSAIDTSVRPQDNFFLYANGTWLKHATIPASQPAWGAIFSLGDQSVDDLHIILDSVAALPHPAKGSIAQQTGDLYASAMDSAKIEQLGISPIEPYLSRINNIKNSQGILDEVAEEYSMGLDPMFSFGAGPDDKNSAINVAHFDQGGLGLPNRDYYFKQDSATQQIRQAYQQYIATTFKLIGDSANADKNAADVMQLEMQLAKASKTPVELRDPIANYHKMTLTALEKTAPSLEWSSLIKAMQIPADTVLVGQPEFYAGLSKLLTTVPLDTWKKYLTFHLVNHFSAYLPHNFVDAEFNFEKLLTGQQEMKERWKRMSSMVDQELGDALGQLYVQRYFPPEAKQRMLKMVNNLQQTYADEIKKLDWMSDSTKQKALVKLHAMVKKIGYPDKWKDYSSVSISRDSIINNIINCGHYEYMRNIHKIGKPVDESEWYMTPPTVDAYYNPTTNDINFPAGILQPPFFFKDGDDAVNYGAIGIVIGHEMTHGFDDQGRQYDAHGNLSDWWTPQDADRFKAKAQEVVNQYDHYYVLDSLHINGAMTLGENIADIGGTAIAYAAFQKTAEAKSGKKIDGFTPDQRFFLSLAQIWRVKYRPQIMRTIVMSNPHSTAMYRVDGPASDTKGFYHAFDVKPGDGMYRPDSTRVDIW